MMATPETKETLMLAERLQRVMKAVPDFPKPGIQFVDIAPILADAPLFHDLIVDLGKRYRARDVEAVMGLEARGFIIGAALAYELKVPFVPMRKPGKLPGETMSTSYKKEYGEDRFEIQKGVFSTNQRVLIVDDILATGGTAEAACQLVRKADAEVVEVACLVAIPGLEGEKNVSSPVHLVVQ